jgi:hypothetical protein
MRCFVSPAAQAYGQHRADGRIAVKRDKLILFLLIGLMSVGGTGCSTEMLLWPFGNYWIYKTGAVATDALNALVSSLLSQSASNTTSGTTTARFSDSFGSTSLNGWSIVSGSWAVVNGAVQSTGPATQGYYMMVTGQTSWTNYTVNLKTMLEAGTDYAVGVRWQDNQTWYACTETINGLATITKFTASQTGGTVLAQKSIGPAALNTWHSWRIDVQGSAITFTVDGVLAGSVTDTSSPLTSGKVALMVAPGCIADFDDVQITPLSG